MIQTQSCPACRSNSRIENVNIEGTIAIVYLVDCPRCGKYQIEYVAREYLNVDLDAMKQAVLSHGIRALHKDTNIPVLDQITVARILQGTLPKPNEQVMKFILWIGDETGALGVKIKADLSMVQSEIGAANIDGVRSIVDYLVARELVEERRFAGTPETTLLRTFALTITGWDYYEKLKQITDTSNTGKLLKCLIESRTSSPDAIKKKLDWNDEQFQAAFEPLKRKRFIDAKYADNQPYILWITPEGRTAVEGFQPELSVFPNSNILHHYGDNVSIQTSGDNQNVIVGNNSNITNGLSGSDIAKLFEEVFHKIDQKNIGETQKQEIRETVELIQDEVSKGEKVNEKALTSFSRSLQKMAPDILEVVFAATTNPMLAASVIVKKVAEKIKADAK